MAKLPDTTQPGTHTILYTVTDPKGLKGSASRTVIVEPVNPFTREPLPPASTSTPANDNATTTDILLAT